MATNPKKEKLAALKVEQLKPKAKRLGVKLTNPSGNAKTKAQLINAIVKAEEKKPAAKKPAAKRRVVKKGLAPVVGASKRQALPPGRRVSKGGKVYYERRANRADAGQGAAKGQMLGEKYQAWTNYWTWKFNLELVDQDRWLEFIKDGAYSSIYDLSQDIKNDAEEFLADGITPDFAQDWFLSALSFVNWREIAEAVAEGTDLK